MNKSKIASLITFSVTLLLFSSCRTGRQVVVVEGKDSIRIEERLRYVQVVDTFFMEVPPQSAERTTADSSSHLENDYAMSDARILSDGSLFHTLETKPRTDTLTRELSVQAKDSIIYREKVVPQPVPIEKPMGWFTQMRLWLGNLMLALIAGAVAWAAARLFLKR
ncbi:MAG TPA: hypothetical protein IAD09_06265 [Candidatus Caccoplasma merdavium]|nr:hypothetical protein [Candidatus Caccoplasma merdavium]